MRSNSNTVHVHELAGTESREAVKALFHELQNCLHSATMEIELARLVGAPGIDGPKLLRILDSFKITLRSLRECVLPLEELSREDPITILNAVLAGVEKKFSDGKIKVNLHQRCSMPSVELNAESARYAFELVLNHCCRRLRTGGNLEIVTGAKLLNGREFAEIGFTSVPSSFNDSMNDERHGGVVNDATDMDLILASQILKRYGTEVSLVREENGQPRITLVMRSAR